MTPLNRAAQALHESLNTADISMNGDLATFAVIAVLKAIWEPSSEMVEAGVTSLEEQHWDDVIDSDASHAWQAMLDTIINEGGAK